MAPDMIPIEREIRLSFSYNQPPSENQILSEIEKLSSQSKFDFFAQSCPDMGPWGSCETFEQTQTRLAKSTFCLVVVENNLGSHSQDCFRMFQTGSGQYPSFKCFKDLSFSEIISRLTSCFLLPLNFGFWRTDRYSTKEPLCPALLSNLPVSLTHKISGWQPFLVSFNQILVFITLERESAFRLR